jgi:hypothetical protein
MQSRMVRPQPKEKPVKDEKFKVFVRTKKCSVCGKRGAVAHHQSEKGKSVMGGKVSDRRCLPFCPDHHEEYHRIGRETFARKHPRWNPEGLIGALNREYDSG